MTTKNTNKDKGFTIIEVVLVLAIAALIFLMIFIALPALQRGQANTARKQDIGVIASAVNTYRSNKSGVLPTTNAQLATYIDKLAQIDAASAGGGGAPAVDVVRVVTTVGTGKPVANEANIDRVVNVYTKAKCNSTSDAAVVSSSGKQAAVVGIVQVSRTAYDTFCQDV